MSIYLQAARTMHDVERAYQDALDNAGHGQFSPLEMHILLSLYRQDGQRASDLARSVGRAATSFTPPLDKLAQRGYLCRTPHPTDRRAVIVTLTEEGKALREALTTLAETVEKELALSFAAPA